MSRQDVVGSMGWMQQSCGFSVYDQIDLAIYPIPVVTSRIHKFACRQELTYLARIKFNFFSFVQMTCSSFEMCSCKANDTRKNCSWVENNVSFFKVPINMETTGFHLGGPLQRGSGEIPLLSPSPLSRLGYERHLLWTRSLMNGHRYD